MFRKIGLALLLATGCAGGNKMVLEGGWFPNSYEPPPGKNEISTGGLTISIDKIYNGGYGTNFFVDVTVRNSGNRPIEFDGADVELNVADTGMSYSSITKNYATVTVPLGLNLIGRVTLQPGKMTSGTVWFQTPQGKAEGKKIEVSYKGSTVRFPPEMTASR